MQCKSFDTIEGELSCTRVHYFWCLVISWVLNVTNLEHTGVDLWHVEGCGWAVKWAIFLRWGRTEGGFYDIIAAQYLYGPGSITNYPPTTFLGVNLCGLSHQLSFTPLLFPPTFMTVTPSQGLPMAKKTPYCYVLYVWTIDWPRLSNVYAPGSAFWVSLMGLAS